MRKTRYLLGIGLAMSLAGWRCSGSSPSSQGGTPGVQIAVFAKELAETQTSDTNDPSNTEDQNLVDGEDPSAFDPNGDTFPPVFFH